MPLTLVIPPEFDVAGLDLSPVASLERKLRALAVAEQMILNWFEAEDARVRHTPGKLDIVNFTRATRVLARLTSISKTLYAMQIDLQRPRPTPIDTTSLDTELNAALAEVLEIHSTIQPTPTQPNTKIQKPNHDSSTHESSTHESSTQNPTTVISTLSRPACNFAQPNTQNPTPKIPTPKIPTPNTQNPTPTIPTPNTPNCGAIRALPAIPAMPEANLTRAFELTAIDLAHLTSQRLSPSTPPSNPLPPPTSSFIPQPSSFPVSPFNLHSSKFPSPSPDTS